MATPDTRHSLVVSKQFSYRGASRVFSNRYHFEGALPPDDAHWTTLADNVTADESVCLLGGVTIVSATGYDSGSATSTNPHGDAVFTKTYSISGLLAPGTGQEPGPGDSAAMLRFSTPARTTKNHPVYLFNFFHPALLVASGGDDLSGGQITAVKEYGDDWIAGFTDGAIVHERCGPRGAVAIDCLCDPFVRHRDFPN